MATTPRIKKFKLTALPDAVDFRDQMFVPTLVEVPATRPLADYKARIKGGPRILDQGEEGACTGFGLAACAHYLLWTGGRFAATDASKADDVSPWMLYTVAKRYDEWPGEKYEGSSARGAMKAWHHHGVCSLKLWKDGSTNASDAQWTDRWSDARRRPLGAYFRVNHKDLVAMHAAITEVGVLYATALVHGGWDPDNVEDGVIEYGSGDAGHAFAIVGYDADGLWVQNSWGRGWGKGGFARLGYDDWLENGMDVWVARLGAPVNLTERKTSAVGLSTASGATRSYVFCDLRPHVVSVGNDGLPRTSGTYGTDRADIERIFGADLPSYLASVKPTKANPAHVLLYAHGGLVPETSAIQRIADLRAPLLDQRVFPVAFVWKTDFWTTLTNILRDALKKRQSEGVIDGAKDFMLDRFDDALEPLARVIGGKAQWDEMKENAVLATTVENGAARIAARALAASIGERIAEGSVRLHVVGHSAGSIFHGPLVQLLAGARGSELDFELGDVRPARIDPAEGLGLPIDSLTLWAPACTVDLFQAAYRPLIAAGGIRRFALMTLTDDAERDDNCARVYNKSLLYLVSHAFEEKLRIPLIRKEGEPILGMARFAAKALKGLNQGAVRWIQSPDPEGRSSATAHGAFDDNKATLEWTLAFMLGRAAKPAGARFEFRRTASGRLDRRKELERMVPNY